MINEQREKKPVITGDNKPIEKRLVRTAQKIRDSSNELPLKRKGERK